MANTLIKIVGTLMIIDAIAFIAEIIRTIIRGVKEEKMKEEKPYIIETITIQKKKYNPNYGDNRMCVCGHTYYRHFDPWNDMEAVGCKYCGCQEFVEAKSKEYVNFADDLIPIMDETESEEKK